MEYIYIGEIVNTHGVRGEVRIISDFKYKDLVFKNNFTVYVGRFKDKLKIHKYRRHKIYDMVTFYGIENINDVIMYKGDEVYINSLDLKVDDFFNEQLIGLEVIYNDKSIGNVECIINNNAHDILVISGTDKKHMVPNLGEFIKSVDLENQKMYINYFEGLIDED